MSSIIFIVGPTATGKTELAYNIAKRVEAEIISCDSMLVYQEPKIITSKPPAYMLESVKHNFVNLISAKESYDVFTYYSQATKVITDLFARKVPVIVCGGTGLYAGAILDGIFSGASRVDSLRASLEEEAESKGKDSLYAKLKQIDPEAANKISPNDLKRIIRALEVYYLTGKTISQKHKERKGLWRSYPIKIFGLSLNRDLLYKRINNRVDKMFEQGVVEEVKTLLKLNLSLTAKKIIGIKEIAGFLEGKMSLTESKEEMKKNTRRFAKRQFTWFKKDHRVEWVDVENMSVDELSKKIL